MQPDRKKVIQGTIVEEYYWAGGLVTYIDNRLSKQTFDEACITIKKCLECIALKHREEQAEASFKMGVQEVVALLKPHYFTGCSHTEDNVSYYTIEKPRELQSKLKEWGIYAV